MTDLHISVLAALLGFLAVVVWRIREGRRPVSVRAIIFPPLGMSTGLSMFLIPAFRAPWSWAAVAFGLGAVLLAILLMQTSHLTVEGPVVMVQRSSTFFLVIIALASLRFFARQYICAYVTLPQTASLSFLLALGMITRWRTTMYMQYKRIVRSNFPLTVSAARQ